MKPKFIILWAVFLGVLLIQIINHGKNTVSPQKTAVEKTALLKKPIRTVKAHAPRPVEPAINETNSIEEKLERKLSQEEVEAYLAKTKRCAECLINAFFDTKDLNYFKEALEKFPDNPHVQMTLLTDPRLKDELSPEERKLWVERLKSSLPNNGFPNYLAAMDAFKNGQTDVALNELNSAAGKTTADPLYRDRIQSAQEMYLLSGFPPGEAGEKVFTSLPYSNEAKMKGLSLNLAELEKSYIASGDNASAEQIAKMGIDIAHGWGSGKKSPLLISQYVGMSMERILMKELNPDTAYDFLGGTPRQRIQELDQQKQEYKEVITSFSAYPRLSDSEKLVYWNRIQTQSELSAMKWLQETYGTAKP